VKFFKLEKIFEMDRGSAPCISISSAKTDCGEFIVARNHYVQEGYLACVRINGVADFHFPLSWGH
jgi:hypothetical protein